MLKPSIKIEVYANGPTDCILLFGVLPTVSSKVSLDVCLVEEVVERFWDKVGSYARLGKSLKVSTWVKADPTNSFTVMEMFVEKLIANNVTTDPHFVLTADLRGFAYRWLHISAREVRPYLPVLSEVYRDALDTILAAL